MSFTFGFYNSFQHDRLYDAVQVSQIFDGIISDGVYATFLNQFITRADGTSMNVLVDTGRAWFNHTWSLNDAILPVEVEPSEVVLNRIDTLVIQIDSSEAVRENKICWVKGTPATDPLPPTLTNTLTLHQYPLCDVYVKADTQVINQEDITNRVGTSDCPFVTGLMSVVATDELIIQWEDQWERYLNRSREEFRAFMDNIDVVLEGDVVTNLIAQINRNRNNLAYVELTNTASKAHKIGEAIIFNNQLYVVVQNIPIDGTLVPDTNIVASTAMAHLYDWTKKMEDVKIFTVTQANWVLNSQTNMYEYVMQLDTVYNPSPDISLCGSAVGVAATKDEIKAFSLLAAGATYINTDDNKLHLFANKQPQATYYILIKGAI